MRIGALLLVLVLLFGGLLMSVLTVSAQDLSDIPTQSVRISSVKARSIPKPTSTGGSSGSGSGSGSGGRYSGGGGYSSGK